MRSTDGNAPTRPPAVYVGDYPSLLAFGLHSTSVTELRSLCVAAFPRSSTRTRIMDHLERVIRELAATGISGTLWVDGSFLTEKTDPHDVDIVFLGDAANGVDLANPEHIRVIRWLSSNLKASHDCDSYVNIVPALAGAQRDAVQKRRQYWQRQFGYSRGNLCKGIAVVRIG